MIETLRRARDLQGLPRTTSAPARSSSSARGRTRRAPGRRRASSTSSTTAALHDAGADEARQPALRAWRSTTPSSSHASAAPYPRDELDRLWKLLLLQQFHDILPGSSIGLVYEDAERDLATVEAGAECALPAHSGGDAREHGRLRAPRGRRRRRAACRGAPFGVGAARRGDDEVTRRRPDARERAPARDALARTARSESVLHKASGREALAAPGNRLELDEDRPVDFEAWDIDPSTLETRRDYAPATSWSRELDAAPRRDRVRAAAR